MGTRSTITFIGKRGDKEIPYVRVFQMFDGYLEGVGLELINWLDEMEIVNGISEYTSGIANGFGCLIAQYIRDFKPELGGLYVDPLTSDLTYVDYNYDVIYSLKHDLTGNMKASDCITLRISNFGGEPFFTGTVNNFREYIKQQDCLHG